MPLPNVSLGNTFSDVSSGANSFAAGLMEQRTRQQQIALQQALAAARQAAAERPPTPFSIVAQTPNGLEHGLMDKRTGQTQIATGPGSAAPASQILLPTQSAQSGVPGYATTPRYQTGQPATPVQLPQGQVGRMEPPSIQQVETPGGPGLASVQARTGEVNPLGGGGPQSGGTLQPRAQQFEVEKAQFAANMARAAHAMESASPDAVERVVGRQNLAGILQTIPFIGAPAGEVARDLMAVGLKPDEAQWLANFNTFLGFAVPELAGKQMTITEMRQQAAMFAPLLSEPEESKQIKRGNSKFRVQSAIRASGSGWSRLLSDPTVAGQIPFEYGGALQAPPPQVVAPSARYQYTPRQ